MAALLNHLPLAFLLFLAAAASAASASPRNQARESRFFSKAVRSEDPSQGGDERPMSLPPESHTGYGLYGHNNNNNNNNNDDEDEEERYGMSEARPEEKGEYYYDAMSGTYREDYDPTAEDVEGGGGSVDGRRRYKHSYGGGDSKNGHDEPVP